MNENLNLVEILKDSPKGIKLYSTIFGDVKFNHVENDTYPIVLDVREGFTFRVSQDGRYLNDFSGECTLFPSKEQRDWSKFNPKKNGLVSTCEFKDGDIVATNSGSRVFILQRAYSDVKGYCYVGYDFDFNEFFFSCRRFDRLASEEEKQKLFDAIKERGYRWNAETKILEKLIKPKFDPKTLHPFDRVLVRLTRDCIWNATFFSHYDKEINWGCHPCVTTSCKSYDKCIPYNDETKHLLGTSDEAPEYYRYWED